MSQTSELTRVSYILFWFAWLVFITSLLTPAVQIDPSGSNRPTGNFILGVYCAFVGWQHYASNIVMLFAPLCLWLIRRWCRSSAWIVGLAFFYGLSGLGCLLWLPMIVVVGIGYFLWCVSYLFATWAALIAVLDWPEETRAAKIDPLLRDGNFQPM